MTWWQAVLFGIVEGITEFLPISSTGHLILTARLLGIPQTEFMKSFEIAIQFGAILAVVVIYGRWLFTHSQAMLRIVSAFIPTAILGALLYKIVKHYLLANEQLVLWTLFLGGIFLIVFDRLFQEKPGALDDLSKVPLSKTIGIGAFQSIAMIPGVSRSAATIVGGLMLGLSRRAIVEFSFFLAVPTIAAAMALDLVQSGSVFASTDWSMLILGMVVSFIVAILAIRFFIHYVQRHGFTAFGIYRIASAVLFWFLLKV